MTISARGARAPASESAGLAIGKVTVGGSVERAEILAGYDRVGAAVHADARIGALAIGRNWIASSAAAGVQRGTDGFFGTDDDLPIAGGTPLVSAIASIVIRGFAAGTGSGADHFGFVAEQLGALRYAGTKLPLKSGPGNDLAGVPLGSTDDLRAREVAGVV